MSLIYHYINKHNKKFNENKLFLSKKLRNQDDFFIRRISIPFLLPLVILAMGLFLFFREKYWVQITTPTVLFSITLLFFLYRYAFFNRKAKKETNYKRSRNIYFDFFTWWLTPELKVKQLKKIGRHYSKEKAKSLLKAAELEYNYQNSKCNFKHFEAILLSILALMLAMVIDLKLISHWLESINNGKELSLDDKLYFMRVVLYLIVMIIIMYRFIIWNINQDHRNKKDRLKSFIETLHLAKRYMK